MSQNNMPYSNTAPSYEMPRQGQPYPPQNMPSQRQPVAASVRRTKNKFLTFVLACMPGAGQMYHGLMKKGISIMILFWGIIAVSAITYLSVINFILPVIWFYSFFDAVNRMNMTLDELKALEDCYLLIGNNTKSDFRNSRVVTELFQKRHKLIGWGLIGIAVWVLLNMACNLSYYLLADFNYELYRLITRAVDMIPMALVPLLCIIIGMRLITGGMRKKQPQQTAVYDEYTIPSDLQEKK